MNTHQFLSVFTMVDGRPEEIEGYQDHQCAVLGSPVLEWWEHVALKGGLSADCIASVKEYTRGRAFQELNNYLRYGSVTPGRKSRKELELFKARIVAAIEKSPAIPDGVVLWRGIGNAAGRQIAELDIEDDYADEAVLSTSISFDTGRDYAEEWQTLPSDGIHYTILRFVTSEQQKGIFYPREDESEIILRPETLWRVTNKHLVEGQRGRTKVYYHIITMVSTGGYS